MIKNPQKYRWSSASTHLAGRDDRLVYVALLLEMFGKWGDFLFCANTIFGLIHTVIHRVLYHKIHCNLMKFCFNILTRMNRKRP
ncbi:MAG: hypothetical protein DWB56_12265 [Candidatus Jettenia sp.]|nr:hypothetical protein [Candidatus Jettenia sp.]